MIDYAGEAQELFAFTREIRRDLHCHPELGFEEYRTAGIVTGELNNLGYTVTPGVGKTGVVGLLESAKPGPVILLRFDMDALPVTEETGLEFASVDLGKMHACGHDGHVAIGLTVARILKANIDQWRGTIKLVFQPAEEGLGGAEEMIRDGVLEHPKPDYCLALHLWNELPVGTIGLTRGAQLAGGDFFKVKITGKGGHGALPHQAVDPIVASAQIILALQTIVSRNVSPLQTAVVSVTKVNGGETFNVIPPMVELQGTIRTFSDQVHDLVVDRFKAVVNGIAAAMDCQADISIHLLTLPVRNDDRFSIRLQDLFGELFPWGIIEKTFQSTVSEDMAFIMDKVPGCYFMVGSANVNKDINYGHHHPKFDIDESALPLAVAAMCAAAVEMLNSVDFQSGDCQSDNFQSSPQSEDLPPVTDEPTLPEIEGRIPGRVVSLVPSMTESLCELGMSDALVGITDYCIHPKEALVDKTRVGGVKNARLEDILALKPDLVLANYEENSKELIEALNRSGVPTWVTLPKTVNQAVDDLYRLAGLFRDEKALLKLRTLSIALDWTRQVFSEAASLRYFCPVWQDKSEDGKVWWVTFNEDTYINDLLKTFKGDNIFSARKRRYPLMADLGLAMQEDEEGRDVRFPRVTTEEVIAADPELILLPDEPYLFGEDDQEFICKLLASVGAVKNGRVYRVDGSLLTWHGTRLGKALSELPIYFQ